MARKNIEAIHTSNTHSHCNTETFLASFINLVLHKYCIVTTSDSRNFTNSSKLGNPLSKCPKTLQDIHINLIL